MRSRVVFSPAEQAETVRRSLRAQGVLRAHARAVRERGEVGFPILSEPQVPIPGTRIEEREIGEPRARPAAYRDSLRLPPNLQNQLPRAFDVIGEIVLVRLPDELEDYGAEIGTALLRFVPGARRVGWDRGVHGEARLRDLVPLAGSGSWRTRYRENGLEFVVDPERAYFSPRLAREHHRIATETRPSDRVWDLCCGIGPFALTIAARGRGQPVVAVDSNPEAVALLRENARLLGVEGRVLPREQRVEEFLAGGDVADRVIFNLPHEGIKYLPSVAAGVAPGGSLHYYEVTPRADRSGRGITLVERLEPAGAWRCTETRRVHPYSPQADLLAFTLQRS